MSSHLDTVVALPDGGLHIDGATVPAASGAVFETRDPGTGRVLATVARGDGIDVDTAVASAERAFRGWSATEPVERARVLYSIAAAIRAQAEKLAQIETLDNGKPISQARGDVEVAARYFEYYAGLADKGHGLTVPLGERYLSYTRPEPYGVTAHIIPWNVPLQQAARGLAPALAAANTAVVKPAEDTPLSCLALATVLGDAGLPPGVVNMVTGFGGEAGVALARHPGVRKVVFTGSVPTGRRVMEEAAKRLAPVTLELGGKSPNIVFADADLEAAIEGAWQAFTLNAGQVCSAGTRLLVERPIVDEVLDGLIDRARRMTLGLGLDDPEIGPLTTRAQFSRVRDYLRIGREEGARVAIGGGVPTDPALAGGMFVEPTVFTGATNTMRIAREEIFGPVLTVIAFGDDDEAVQVANDSPYGLVAGLWTRDLGRAHRAAAALDCGQVFVNEWWAGGVETPFGGVKDSGFGREKGAEALAHYTHTKTITVRL